MPTLHSTSQASYVLTGLLEQPNPQRHDLRPLQAYRPIHLQRGVAPTASGSAKVSLGGTEVTVAVSCQIEAVAGGNVPGPSSGQSRGGVEASVQFSNTLIHSSLPSSIPSLDALSTTLTSLLGTLGSTVPLSELEIIPNSRYWTLHIDAYVTSLSGGNIEDALCMAAHAALNEVRVPRTRAISYQSNKASSKGKAPAPGAAQDFLDPKSGASGGADIDLSERLGIKGSVSRSTGGRAVDFELLDSGEGGEFFSNRETLPVCVSVYILPNGQHLLDPTLAESDVLTSRVHVLADKTGSIYGVTHASGISQEEPETAGKEGAAAIAASAVSIGTEQATMRAAIRIGANYAKELAAHLQSQIAATPR